MHPYRVRDLEALRQAMANSKRTVRTVPHSVRSVAELAGTSHGTIGNIMTGAQERVSEDVARSIAEAFGVPIGELFVRDLSTSCDVDKREAS